METGLTIKEQELIESLLLQHITASQSNLDEEIEQLIKNAQSETREMADNKLNFYRANIRIEDEDFDIDDIVKQVEQITHEEKEYKVGVMEKKISVLEEFNEKQMQKLRLEDSQFVELEGRYPKVKECLGQKVQYPCVQVVSGKAERWFAFNGKDITDVVDAVLFIKGETEFRIYSIDQQLYCFTNVDNFSQALIIKPGKNKPITHIDVSSCKKYFVIAMVNQIVIYQINSHKSVSVVKNITDMKLDIITSIGFCKNGYELLYVVNQQKELILVTITNTFIFLRVEASKMDVCLSNIMVVTPMKLMIDEDQYEILAIASKTEVAIYLIFPNIQLLHIESFEDQLAVARLKSNCQGNSIDDHFVNLKWRYDSNSKIKPQLIISFWDNIIILKMTEANNDVIPFSAQFDRFLYYTNHYPIISFDLTTYNHLLILSTKNVIVVALPLITSSESGDQCQQSSIVYVNSSIYNKLFKSFTRRVMLLSDSKIDIFEIVTLQSFIDKQINQKSDYLNIFSLLLLVCKGLNYSFDCNYNETQLTKIVFYSIESLLISLSKVIIDDNTLAIRLYWVCELLIQSGREQLIWSLVFSTVSNTLKKTQILFQCLQIFFLKTLIHAVPCQIFSLIVQNYVSRERSKVLLKAMVSVNLQGHNVQRYLQLINQKRMTSLFIFLFQNINEEGDYLTPFIKIFANFKFTQNVQQKQYLGKLSLWYLYKSIKGYKFPEIAMTQSQKQICWSNILIQPLNPSIFKTFLESFQALFLTIYLYIFTSDQIISYIEQNQQSFLQKLKIFDTAVKFDQPVLRQLISYIKKIYSKPQAIIYRFISICSLKISIQPELLFQTSLYYLSHPNLINGQKQLTIINPIRKDSGQILLSMLISLRPLLKSDRLYLKKLLAHKSYQWQVVSYLHFLDNKYQTAIQKLLDSQKRDHIFILLQEIMKSYEQSQIPLVELHSIVLGQIGRLIKVNSLETLLLLYELKISIDLVLKQLKKMPELKLQFITSIILNCAMQGKEQDIGLLIQHLQLVCEFEYKNVMKYLKRINYPLDDATKICERYNHFEGKAFMLERSGDILGALHSYEKAIILKIKDKQMLPSALKPLIHKYFQAAITICKNNPCSSLTPIQQNNWLCLMQITKDIQDSKHSQKVDVMIQLNNYFTKIHQQLFNHVPAKILLQYFLQKDRGFLPRVILKTWHTLSILFKFQNSMYNMAISTNIIDTTIIVDSYSHQKWKGIFFETTHCSFCDNPLSDEKQLVYFSCGHFFHKICHKSKICLVCKFQSDSLLVKSFLDKFVRKRKQSQTFDINSSRKRTLSNDIMVIEIQSAQQRRKKLRPKLKAFDFQQLKLNNQLQQTFQYYFDTKKQEPFPLQPILIEKDQLQF